MRRFIYYLVIVAVCSRTDVLAQDAECVDMHELCSFWSNSGECERNTIWMRPNCPISCNSCADQQRERDILAGRIEPDPAPVENTPAPAENRPAPAPAENRPAPATNRFSGECPNVIDREARTGMSMDIVRSNNANRGCVSTSGGANCQANICFHRFFRAMDGMCNNLQQPNFGAAFEAPMRLVQARFDDGLQEPRGAMTRMTSPRTIVADLLSSQNMVEKSDHNMLVMQWGQFVAHDITKTTLLPSNRCGQCQDIRGVCFNIPVQPFDRAARNFGCNGRDCCIRLARTTPVCGTGDSAPKVPMNENTAFIDGSMIYGSSVPDANRLRDGQSPFMRVQFINGMAFPPNDNSGRLMFTAGDDRINVFVGLAAMHSIFLREHNRIANALRSINPHWSSDRVYHESRKIVGAEVQKITYDEWLPIILGSRGVGGYSGYSTSVNPAISLEFSTGIFRFGHGTIQEFFPRLNDDGSPISAGGIRFTDGVLNPSRLVNEGGTDPLIRGMADMGTKMPQRITTSVTDRLFGNMDLASININRGRDNGIGTYNDLRAHCGMNRATTFDGFSNEIREANVRSELSRMYKSPDEVDLWVGAVLEDPVSGGMVGPTMACVISDQFRRIRSGDRFWFENADTFTSAQRAEISRVSLSRIICDTGERMIRIPNRAFVRGTLTDCSNIPGINLQMWRE